MVDQNYEVLDTYKLPKGHYVTLRVIEEHWQVELFCHTLFNDISLAELWIFVEEDDALDCFCRFIPEYLEDVIDIEPSYRSMLRHEVYPCRKHISMK